MKSFIKRLKKSIFKKYKLLITFLFRGYKILVLSDSHGEVFEYIHDNNMLLPHFINVEMVGGATAYGLNNEISETRAIERFQKAINKFRNYNIILIQLGEVDTSYILWKKMKENNLTMDDVIKLSIEGYEALIKRILMLKKNIIISGVVLPTLKDGQKVESMPLRNTIPVSQKERTLMVLKFNKELKKLAQKYNLKYFDITNDTLDFKTGVIKDEFIKKDVVDVHQNYFKTAPIWVKYLKNILEKR